MQYQKSIEIHSEIILYIMFMTLKLVAVLLLAVVVPAVHGELVVGFYQDTCPKAEALVQQAISHAFASNPGIAPGIIRLLFHDCFVKGCDASVLLDVSADGSSLVEKDANISQSLRGFEAIDDAKASVEEECPGVVSCADILNFAARESAKLTGGGITWDVPAGRRDTRLSIRENIEGNFLGENIKISVLVESFKNKGLTAEDLVILSGAHSLGITHCLPFQIRLYEDHRILGSPPQTDPTLSLAYADLLRSICLAGVNNSTVTTSMDIITPNTLDNKYYVGVLNNLGLFKSDQALVEQEDLLAVVKKSAENATWWREEFGRAMVKMGNIEVLEGTSGEIRTNCRIPNGFNGFSGRFVKTVTAKTPQPRGSR